MVFRGPELQSLCGNAEQARSCSATLQGGIFSFNYIPDHYEMGCNAFVVAPVPLRGRGISGLWSPMPVCRTRAN